jgi:hypothetical protein
MAETQVSSVFEMQRTMIEQNRKAVSQFMDVQRAASESFVEGLEGLKRIQEQNVELTQDAVHAYFDTLEQLPGDADFDEARELVDENFDTLEEAHAEAWAGVLESIEDGQDSVEEYTETYGDLVDSSFDSFLDAHESVEKDLSEAEAIDIHVDEE